jgi:nitroimidazol reductase NimA-like FMN-containing flavoprotein (pyridoxamine 5'-phosphate oxidase superfamily)
MPADYPPTDRTRVRRKPDRGAYDADLVHAVLDAAPICHVGFVHAGSPVVIPTIHGRVEDVLYLHGSPASRMLRTLRDGVDVAVNAVVVDGIVLARSLFHHSMNYRSVVVMGRARPIDDPEEKTAALRAITEHLVPGRWDDARAPSEKEDRGTLVVAVPIVEASAKVRSGPPGDDEDDLGLPYWTGVIPLRLAAGKPEPAPDMAPGTPLPPYLDGFAP